MRRISRLLGCSLLVVGSARAAEVVAQGPSECPDADELGFRLERGVGLPLAQAPAMRFAVEMERTAGGYAARLTVAGQGEEQGKERSLTGADCEELADAVVVAMTLALGVGPVPEASAPAEVSAGSAADVVEAGHGPSSAAGVVPPAAPAAADAGDDRTEEEGGALRPAISVAALVDVGSLPAPSFGAAFGAELGWQRLQLRALGTILFEQHTEVGGSLRPAPGADLQLFAGSLLGCSTAVGVGVFTLPLCLGLELGWLSGVGTGVTAPRSGSAAWAAPRADAGAVWCLQGSPVCLGATVTALAPIARSRFALTDVGTVYRPPTVTGRLSIYLGVGFD